MKSNKLWPWLLLPAVLIVFLVFLIHPKSDEYQTGVTQSVKMITDQDLYIPISGLQEKQLIDLRLADRFAQGHAEMAINIPVRNLLDNESLELFDRLKKNGQEAVLYGNDELQAIAPCMLLQQMGYSNIKMLKGKFNANNQFEETPQPATEVMLLDATAMQAQKETTPTTQQKKLQVVVPIRKETSSGGGC